MTELVTALAVMVWILPFVAARLGAKYLNRRQASVSRNTSDAWEQDYPWPECFDDDNEQYLYEEKQHEW